MWVKTPAELGLKPEDHFYPWLVRSGPLSAALKQLCQNLSVQVISQQLETATPEEQQALNIQETNSLIRQVYLCGDNVPWIHARLVVPHTTYQSYKPELDNLGDKLLGEAFLYSKSGIQRSPFEFSITPEGLFSRRSIFEINIQQLMLRETFIFLNAILNKLWPHNNPLPL